MPSLLAMATHPIYLSVLLIVLSVGASNTLAQTRGPLSASRRSTPGATPSAVNSRPDKAITVVGKLIESYAASLLIEASNGNKIQVILSPETRFVLADRIIAVETLKVGDGVTVYGFEKNPDRIKAVQVSVHLGSLANVPWNSLILDRPETTRTPLTEDDDGTPPILRRRQPTERHRTGGEKETRGRRLPTSKRGKPSVEERRSENTPDLLKITEHTLSTSAQTIRPKNVGVPDFDPVIAQTREWVFSYSAHLPNFICREIMTRTAQQGSHQGWRTLDVIEADVVYENRQENYRNIRVNGHAVKHNIDQLEGSWSMGEFASALLSVFAPSSQTRFRFSRFANITGQHAKVYQFSIRAQNSHWQVSAEQKTITPAYSGSVWIDGKTSQVIRIEKHATDLPEDFGLHTIEMTVDYNRIRISGTEHLLPVRSENLGCWRATDRCVLNKIEFRNYRKFSAESTIITTDIATDYDGKGTDDAPAEAIQTE